MPRGLRFVLLLCAVILLLHALPYSLLVLAPAWPAGVTIALTAFFVLAMAAFPLLMIRGHGKRHQDRCALIGDAWLGVIWQYFVWSIAGWALYGVLAAAGLDAPLRGRIAAIAALVWTSGVLLIGFQRAMRVPPAKHTDVFIDRLGTGLDGVRLVIVADTHFGPINRTTWSRGLVAAVNALKPEILAHVGDIADGTVEMRREQAAPLSLAEATLARVYITGNHEYITGAAPWIDHMTQLGWEALHNRHIVVSRGGHDLIIAGVDDLTAAGSGQPGQGADLDSALLGAGDETPVLLLAHQPKQVREAIASGVDLQISGHTHGGQLWPFHYLVRLDQKFLHGLSRHNSRTQMYVSRGAGFWGPPFRVFAPNEISVLTLRSGAAQ
ncbi:metallophosphoesterase [Nakamurella antarctica]|uniref:Metallophosphoesterase n=1 Tax=Nakamurella antarctica TaxID=1902245 RepID=A0A3G8ZL52_9ACTN|nr:metallophosphoesterase [Nakamurella antarctica]AZI57930.1 metallophosphoesterase [Nakamurella antarctica]